MINYRSIKCGKEKLKIYITFGDNENITQLRRKPNNTDQEDGTWSDEPRCIEHEAGVSSQVSGSWHLKGELIMK